MKKIFFTILFLIVFLVPFLLVRADEMEELNKQINDLSKLSNNIKSANNTNKAQLDQLTKQINNIKYQVGETEIEIQKKEKEVQDGEKVLAYQKTLLNERAKSYYKNISKTSNYLINLLVVENLSESLKNFFYQKSMVDEDRKTIIKVVLYIKDLETKKNNLQNERIKLTKIKEEIDKQSQFLAGEVAKANKALVEISQKIAALTTRQQQILAQKLAGLNISRSANTAGRCDSDLTNGRNPGFNPKFGFFTFGVPNRVGLNQYGAWGRAKAHQNETEILQAYYNYDEIKKWDTNIEIRVDGIGNYKLEEYVKRLYEIPDSWIDNNLAALKAQAIAARSYALAYTNNGQGSICATENCQVIKSEPKGGNWEQAVNQTEGQVMVQGGNPIKAWFSSTHGGYIFSTGEIGWSGTSWTKHANDFSGSVNNFDDLKNTAYDKESPWFYCDWGSRTEFDKTAWLKPEELADIVNVILLAKADSGTTSHLSQEDKPNPDGTDTWNKDRVKQELKSKNTTPLNSVSNVSVDWDKNGGRTTNISITGDGGSYNFDGGEFKNFFNLRAPANIQIVGPLYNVER